MDGGGDCNGGHSINDRDGHNEKDDVNVNSVNLENKHLLASEDTIRSCWLLPDPEPGLPS